MSGLSLFAAAHESGTRPCVVTPSRTWTFGEIAAQVAPLVRFLDERPDPIAPVALVPDLRVDSLIAIYAAIEVGAPLVGIHPRLSQAERATLVPRNATFFDETWRAPASEPVAMASRAIDPGRPLAELFTSGSSGVPKAVVLSRAAFSASAQASEANLGWAPEDRWLVSMPLAHVGGLSVVIRCLLARVPVALAAWRTETSEWLRDVGEVRATILSLVPTMLYRVLEASTDGPVFDPGVRVVMIGGDACPPALAEEALRRGVPIVTTYGMSETCAQIATSRPGERPIGSGRPLRGIEVRVVDGELQVRSPTLLTGYRSSRGLESPLNAEGFLATGDLGHLDAEGYLHVSGRRSDLLISGGENVDPVAIETALRSVPGVRDLRAFGIPDPRWGQVIAIAVVGDRGALVALAEAAMRLAPHQRPRRIAFCEALPTGSSGKVERKKLGQLLADQLVALT